MTAPASRSNWDPLLIISQIVTLQTLHYLTLSLVTPPLLALVADPARLDYAGGAAGVGMVMDWREMAGRSTVPMMGSNIDAEGRWFGGDFGFAWAGGKKVGMGADDGEGIDPVRGWVIALCWILACGADVYYIMLLIRRPRLVLDFALTLLFNHILLTTYYAAAIPSSLFFWGVVGAGSVMTVIAAEQLCVQREMREGLKVTPIPTTDEDVEEMEMGERR
ncbi:integral membrane protein S linking to the trans Golgi network-domain-containing protein [Schizophyllum amplum]|uniref:Integral membrane protein S linking to the trans Golgi network-domain-containing protein n=1 Tax=Schizophyllum amplum TaxID=97359 RepID=A0A550C069_9AGAR|nr:integral membrane protein S linking to the trans Golgi network-domain-containing protein [Auriculariopsis ampla]